MRLVSAILVLFVTACPEAPAPSSTSGVRKATTHVSVGSDGLTTEQRNVQERLKIDNLSGSIKHLYVISAYSGQVLMYSTVRGKVTSSGKRLSPSSVSSLGPGGVTDGFNVNIGGQRFLTLEVLGDDGTYGSSMEYLFWFDSAGKYHQHYINGGQIVHISDQPVAVKSVTINMEVSETK